MSSGSTLETKSERKVETESLPSQSVTMILIRFNWCN